MYADPNYFMDYPLPPPTDHYLQPLPPPTPMPQFDFPAAAAANGKQSGAEVAPDCPRCASSNTKFCYYNNYSFSQPRYFCKSCRRYWTKGGSLRSVPVGGGCRKSRRSRASRPSLYQRPGSVSSDSDQMSGSDPEQSCRSDIDLAAVFANYLNPASSAQGETETRPGSEPVFEELGEASALTGHPVFSDQELGGDQNVEFLCHDSGSYGLETMLNEESGQEFLWPDEMSLAGLDWQPTVDLVEECGSFSSDHLIGDSWSLFDLPGCL